MAGSPQPTGDPGSRKAPAASAKRRLGLLCLGALLLLVFVLLVVFSQRGDGHPEVPAGAVAIVEDAGGAERAIPLAEYRRELRRAGIEAGLGRAPRPRDRPYDELKEMVITSLLTGVWIEAEAAELGVELDAATVSDAFGEYKHRFFSGRASYRRYLAEHGLSAATLRQSVRLSLLQEELRAELAERAPGKEPEQLGRDFESKWRSRTTCADPYLVEQCANSDPTPGD